MLKKIFFISLVLIISGGFLSSAYAYQATVLSDAELDSISAAGFDINKYFDINAVLALRQTVTGQNNISAVIARTGDINGVTINNGNTLNAFSSASGIGKQKNIGMVIALKGKIENAFIHNSNTASLTNPQDLTQVNIGIIMAQGNIANSEIINTNSLTILGGTSYSHTVVSPAPNIEHISINYSALGKQSNLGVVVSFAGSITNTRISSFNNRNIFP